MTVVAEDEQGLYVLAGERVGRPQRGQGEGLKKGSQVRAMLKPQGLEGQGKRVDAVRVRYGGQEQLWPAYVSRREKRRGDPPRYAVGQVWRKHNGVDVTVGQVWPDGSMTTSGGQNFDSAGRNKNYPDLRKRALSHMVSAPKVGVGGEYTATADYVYRVGQVYQRGDGSKVTVVRVNRDGSMRSSGGGDYDRTGLNIRFRRQANSIAKLYRDA